MSQNANFGTVKVRANESLEGSPLVTISTTKDGSQPIATIRVEQVTRTIGKGGFLRDVKKVAFIKATGEEGVKVMQDLVKGLKDGDRLPLAGKIIVTEDMEPQHSTHEPKINPTTEEVVEINGQPVYRSSEFTSDMSKEDRLISTPEDVAEWYRIHGQSEAVAQAPVTESAPQADLTA